MTSRSKPRYEADSLVKQVAENLGDFVGHVAHGEDVVEHIELVDHRPVAESGGRAGVRVAGGEDEAEDQGGEHADQGEVESRLIVFHCFFYVQVIERTQEIAIQSQEIQRRERELDRWMQHQHHHHQWSQYHQN